jgi:hypothetical protein
VIAFSTASRTTRDRESRDPHAEQAHLNLGLWIRGSRERLFDLLEHRQQTAVQAVVARNVSPGGLEDIVHLC